MTFKVPNHTADELQAILERLGFRDVDRESAKGKDMRTAFKECLCTSWIDDLILNANGKYGLPTWNAYKTEERVLWRTKDEASQPALDRLAMAIKAVWEEYYAERSTPLERDAAIESVQNVYYKEVDPFWEAYTMSLKALFEFEEGDK